MFEYDYSQFCLQSETPHVGGNSRIHLSRESFRRYSPDNESLFLDFYFIQVTFSLHSYLRGVSVVLNHHENVRLFETSV